MRGVRASGRGEAAGACEVQSVPPGPALAVGSSAAAFAASLRSSGRGVRGGFKAKWVQICPALLSLHVFGGGFMKVLHKTHVYGMGFIMNPLETYVWCISCTKNLTQPLRASPLHNLCASSASPLQVLRKSCESRL